MNVQRWQWQAGLAGLLVVVGLPVAGKLARGTREAGCALDGVEIEAMFRVRIVDDERQAHEFCCIRCAEYWMERRAIELTAIYVTDEVSGKEIEASSAYFVRSSVITMPTTGNRIHVFQDRSDAERHASMLRGTVLLGSERPFEPTDRSAER